MLQIFTRAPVAQMEESDASNVVVAGSTPARSSTFSTSGSDVAGNMRVFQTRFESSNLSFRSKQQRARRQVVKATDCKSVTHEFDSHRALQLLKPAKHQ